MTAAVPTIWLMLLTHMEANNLKLSTLRRVLIGGSACPRAMIEKFEKNYGVTVAHAWGMTEMNPIGSICAIKPDYDANDYEKLLDVKSKQGAAPFTVEMKIVDDSEKELPWDGKTVRPAQGEGRRGHQGLLQGRGRQRSRREWLLRHRRHLRHRSVRQHPDHRPLQGRHQVRRRMDFLDRSGKPRGRPSQGDGGGRDRHPRIRNGTNVRC